MGRGMRNDVFVGNIAFGTTDEDIRRIFSEVGRVLGVRMAVNAETGKPRGYCFVEYDDAATALSAIRNLNNRDVGGRQLRVNFSNNSALVDYAASRREGGGEPARAKATPRQLVEGLSAREVWDALGMIRAPPDAGGFAPPPPLAPTAAAALRAAPPPPPLEAAAAAPSVDLVNAAMKLTPAQLAQLPRTAAKIELLREDPPGPARRRRRAAAAAAGERAAVS
ncbi:hypothetical protein JL720_8632 [Aureococcus anophagefferens]|nr:hypothetical protein JL720_8632 [Aureococcus anophagefferens]